LAAPMVAEAAARCAEGGFVWLGLFEPGEEEMAQVRRLFGLHELAVADALTSHRRPKIESYGDGLRLVILRTAHYDDRSRFTGLAWVSLPLLVDGGVIPMPPSAAVG
jgi:Mg2+ and Co2+ transporter CorA